MENGFSSLTDFQHELLSSLSDKSVSTDSFVALKLENDGWLIDLAYLKEASVPPKIARHAQAPQWIVGIANFRGEVWTIVDMKVLAKNTKTLNPTWGWVTLLRTDNLPQLLGEKKVSLGLLEQHIGLLWTEIVEIAPKAEYAIHPLPEERFCRAHYKDKQGVVWRELDVGQIIGENSLMSSFSPSLLNVKA